MIEIHNLHKRFGDQIVLDGVDFDVREGETVALLGPSGTGKSVLLKHINGLIRPDLEPPDTSQHDLFDPHDDIPF